MMAPPDNDVLPCLQNSCTPFFEGKFVSLVEQKSGIVFDNIKRKEIKKNITVCMEELGEKSFIKYYERLISTEGDGEELKKLINFITINETFFLRVQEHFDILKNVAAPELMHRKKEKSIKVWSAGASSGEEVYSIIITLLSVPGLKEHFDLDVLGTDINDDMLYIARQGVYRGRTLDKVPPEILNYYFEPFRKDRFKVTEEVKKYARFQYLNLVQPLNLDFFGNPDIIFFRNVLIYFNEETTRRLINAFYDMLSDGGYLFLGPSETLWEMSDKFELLMFENAYIYRKKGKAERAQSKAEPPAAPPVSTKPTISTTSTTPTTTSPTPPTPPPPPAHPSFPSTESAGIRQQSPAPAPPPAIFPDIGDKIRIQQEEAVLMIELGDYGKAGKIVEELLKLNPGNKCVILLKMTLLINQSLEEELFDYLTQVNRLHPIFLELHFLLGRYYESKEEIRKAIQEYNKVLFIDQECLQAREGLLRLYNNRGETVNAQREARNILEQLSSGNYKEFEFNVGETVSSIKDRLEKFCTQILS